MKMMAFTCISVVEQQLIAQETNEVLQDMEAAVLRLGAVSRVIGAELDEQTECVHRADATGTQLRFALIGISLWQDVARSDREC